VRLRQLAVLPGVSCSKRAHATQACYEPCHAPLLVHSLRCARTRLPPAARPLSPGIASRIDRAEGVGWGEAGSPMHADAIHRCHVPICYLRAMRVAHCST
jgi:hypothetical protein